MDNPVIDRLQAEPALAWKVAVNVSGADPESAPAKQAAEAVRYFRVDGSFAGGNCKCRPVSSVSIVKNEHCKKTCRTSGPVTVRLEMIRYGKIKLSTGCNVGILAI